MHIIANKLGLKRVRLSLTRITGHEISLVIPATASAVEFTYGKSATNQLSSHIAHTKKFHLEIRAEVSNIESQLHQFYFVHLHVSAHICTYPST